MPMRATLPGCWQRVSQRFEHTDDEDAACSADPAGLAMVLAAPNWTFCSRCTAPQRVVSQGD